MPVTSDVTLLLEQHRDTMYCHLLKRKLYNRKGYRFTLQDDESK